MFLDRERGDRSPLMYAEDEHGFLQRSGLEGSASARDLVNWWLAEFPREHRHSVFSRMESRSHSQLHQFRGAFAELITHRLLTAGGGRVEVAPDCEGQEPDFLVEPDGGDEAHLVEVTSTTGCDLSGKARYVVDALNAIDGDGLRLAIKVHCGGGEYPRKTALRAPFERLVKRGFEDSPGAVFEQGGWWVWGELVKTGTEGGFVVSATPVNVRGLERSPRAVRALMRTRIRDKGRKYRHLPLRTVIAVNICGAGMDLLAEALMGEDGLWDKPGRRSYIMGVLAMDGLNPYFTQEIETVYFPNPHDTDGTPAWARRLTRVVATGDGWSREHGKSAMRLLIRP